jgi:hypothetical protein
MFTWGADARMHAHTCTQSAATLLEIGHGEMQPHKPIFSLLRQYVHESTVLGPTTERRIDPLARLGTNI